MIIEMRTYTVKPGELNNFIKIYNKEIRKIHTEILGNQLGFFFTEIGNLNEVVHLYAYDSFEDRQIRRLKLSKRPEFKKYISKVKNYRELVGFKVDQSGFTSYFSNGKIVNGDGLINSFEFFKYKQKDLMEYFAKYGYPDYILKSSFGEVKDELNFHGERYCHTWSSKEGKMMNYIIHEKS